MAVLGLAPFPKELQKHLGELSASGNGCLQSSFQPQNLLSLWKTGIFQGAEGSHEDGHGGVSLCPAADAQGKDTARVCGDEILPPLVM